MARGEPTRPWTDEAPAKRAETAAFGKTPSRTDVADKAVEGAVEAIAAGRGVPMAQVALAWLPQIPGVTAPIVGTSKPHHLDDAVASPDLRLSPDEVAALGGRYVLHAVAAFCYGMVGIGSGRPWAVRDRSSHADIV